MTGLRASASAGPASAPVAESPRATITEVSTTSPTTLTTAQTMRHPLGASLHTSVGRLAEPDLIPAG